MRAFSVFLPCAAALQYAPVVPSHGRRLEVGETCTNEITGLEWATNVICKLGSGISRNGVTYGAGVYVGAQATTQPYRFEAGLNLDLAGTTDDQTEFAVPSFQVAIGSDIEITADGACANPYIQIGVGAATLDGEELQGAYDSGQQYLFGSNGLISDVAQPCIQANQPYCLAQQTGLPALKLALQLTGSDLCLTFSELNFDSQGNGGFYLDLTVEVAHEENFLAGAEEYCSGTLGRAICSLIANHLGTDTDNDGNDLSPAQGVTRAWVALRDTHLDAQYIEFTRTESFGEIMLLAQTGVAVTDGRRHLSDSFVTADGGFCFGDGDCDNVQRSDARGVCPAFALALTASTALILAH